MTKSNRENINSIVRGKTRKRKHIVLQAVQSRWDISKATERRFSLSLMSSCKESFIKKNIRNEREEGPASSCDGFADRVEKIPESIENLKNFNECDAFDRNEAVNYIAGVVASNQLSHSLVADIFTICKLLRKFPSIQRYEVFNTIDLWIDHDKRLYSFCAVCQSTLNNSKLCTNSECQRFSMCQKNVSESKTIVTFSIRSQMKDLLNSGALDKKLEISALSQPSLCSSISETPKYLHTKKESENKYPDLKTLFLTLNTDGFSKRGNSRSEIWPVFLATNDVVSDASSNEMHRPQNVMLASLMLTPNCKRQDLLSLLQRMILEIEATTENPIVVVRDGVTHRVRLQLYESVLDMAASQKIHGVPAWNTYSGCSRCDVYGIRARTKNGSKVCWSSEEGSSKLYSSSYMSERLLSSPLPYPWDDGYDTLHNIQEGTMKDMLKQLLSNGYYVGAKISVAEKKLWANALVSASIPSGRSTSLFMDPTSMKHKTGREIQEMYDQSLPTLLICVKRREKWTVLVYLHWLLTRLITDKYLDETICESCERVSAVLRKLVKDAFPLLYTMKLHFLVDHIAQEDSITLLKKLFVSRC